MFDTSGRLSEACPWLRRKHLFRGQARLHHGLVPSLFRGRSRQQTQSAGVAESRGIIREAVAQAGLFDSFFDAAFHEPLLQHYGLKTTWLDLVDNVWVALWFACHNALSNPKTPRYLHFKRRNFFREGSPSYVYILMVGTDRDQTTIPGYYKGARTELVKLRVGCPPCLYGLMRSMEFFFGE